MRTPESLLYSVFENFFDMNMGYYFAAFFLGAAVSFVELFSRYSAPGKILTTFSSLAHILVNGAVAMLALWVVEENGLLEDQKELSKVLIVSASAILLLRSSFANIKLKGETFDAGFASVIQMLLRTCERDFDQRRNEEDMTQIQQAMEGVVFERAQVDLPMICLEKMNSISPEESNLLGKDVAQLIQQSTNITKTKSIVLGAKIAKLTGIKVLQKGVSLLSPEIKTEITDLLAELDEKQKQLGEKIHKK